MASYIAHSADRTAVTLMFSKAEADALFRLAQSAYEEGLCSMNSQTERAVSRALDALSASTNSSARRAGYFDAGI